MSQGENDYEKDLQQLTNTVAEKIDEGAQKAESFFSSACIYRVPEDLRKLNERAYTPRLIAIGPLHREDKHLQTPLQHVKLSYTKYLLSRLTAGMEDQLELITAGMEDLFQLELTAGMEDPFHLPVLQELTARIENQLELAKQKKLTVLQECLAELKTSVDDAKKCYAEEVTLDEEMMLVDGCFILEFLYRYRTREVPERDPIFYNGLTFNKVQNDLVLLENQIPFFVLEKLFRLTVGGIPNRCDVNWSLTDYVRNCYHFRMTPKRKSNDSGSAKTWCSPRDCVLGVFGCTTAAKKEEEEVQSGNTIDHHRSTAKYYHILHNLHDGYIPPLDLTNREKPSEIVVMPSASELAYAGVKFVPDESGNTLFNIKFIEPKGLFWWCRSARFVIPPLVIEDSTESYLRNLIALEQCCPGVLQHVSSYAWLMDILVSSDKDIQVLEKAGVVSNYLGASEAIALLSKLCKECIIGNYFLDTGIKATDYSNLFWPKNMALLKRTYFDSPWTFIAFCVGFITFVITLVQFARDFSKKG